MAWYWIVLLILLYVLIGGVVAGIAQKYFDVDDEESFIFIAIFWPLVFVIGIPIIIGMFGFHLITDKDGCDNR